MKIKLTMIYKEPKKQVEIPLQSDWIEEETADLFIADMQKTGRFFDLSIIDEMNREWTLKEYNKLKEKVKSEPRNPVIYFDGGFNRENNYSGIGIAIYYEKGNDTYRLRSNAKLEELATNNEAEYAALYNALLLIEELEIKNMPCIIRGDAQGVLKQLAGEWPCYEEALNQWLDKIEAIIERLGIKPLFEVISRKENKEADKLAGQALNSNIIHSHIKMV